MTATHHIKIDGRWVKPGEEYGIPETVQVPAEVAEAEPEEPKEEKKPVRKTRKKAE